MLYFKKANFDDIEKEYIFVRDTPADENGFTNDWHGISREEFEAVALPTMLDHAEGRNLPDGFVPETHLFLWYDDEIVGHFRIRHYLCDSLREGSGHIGYFIRKDCRSRGFGKEGLRLTLPLAWDIIPEDEMYFRVDALNIASQRVILANGGYVHHEAGGKVFMRIPRKRDNVR